MVVITTSSLLDVLNSYDDFDYDDFFSNVKDEDIIRIINKSRLTELDFLALLSEKAEKYLENIAIMANSTTIKQFGKVIFIYTPMYISNYCVNQCSYCGFNIKNNIKRDTLTIDEI